MTERPIEQLEARELSALAERHFGIKDAATDPVASKQLRDKMRAEGWDLQLTVFAEGGAHAGFSCSYGPCERHGTTTNNWHGAEAKADTEERAVALAALKAKGITHA